MSDDHVKALRELLEPSRVNDNPDDLAYYGRDWTRQFPPAPLAVVFPQSAQEVQALVRWAMDTGVALVPSGGRTGLSGGAVAMRGEVVVSMDRMRRVLEVDATDRSITVQAGVTTETVQATAAEHGLFYPVDFASRGSSQIGGNIATNAGGIKVIRYGMTRDWVSGLKVVTGRGELLDLNRGLIKNATGYDLRHLFIGSEGTLGVIVEATLRLTDPPRQPQVMVLAVPALDALMHVFDAFRARLTLNAFEFFTDKALAHVLEGGGKRPFDTQSPYYVLVEYEADTEVHQEAAMAAFEDAANEGWLSDGVISQSQQQFADLWHLREGISESLAPHTPYKNDIAVRVARVAPFLADIEPLFAREYPDLEVVWFGHIGDGNLHINILKPADMAMDDFTATCGRVTGLLGQVLERHQGSISAEHGVGLLKKPYLYHVRSDAELDLMRQLKRVFDPHGIMNPAKIFDAD
ncbi:FAD-binding oxidoreductase [Oleiagrimonas sp. C23AA]|uniref:FAD-binding oxidoreductase n=1 Tax=Oleiagrimonas sp. C23AA TaxID=2719047 RepID=UPI00141EBAA6|nr:FAD-binding oxidoreductase [Oleiagrimonas sp. C23AA]NII09120.1 FAD-binding oxidoreductase [Oleiagrimonas sp. C23AA]